MALTLDIIIVNWNSGNLVAECIDSISLALNNEFVLQRVVVVDNASADDSVSNIKKGNLPLKVIKNPHNIGFGSACNQGAKDSKADYLLFLNPDTRLFQTSLSVPVNFLEKKGNEKIGIVGIKLVDENGKINRNCARFPNLSNIIVRSLGFDKLFPKIFKSHYLLEFDHKSSRIVDQVMGSFYLIRKSLFNKLNGYDKHFFMYYEDLDLAYRAKKLGYYSYYLAEAQVYHKGGGTTENMKDVRLFYNLRSKLLYGKKFFNTFQYYIINLTVLYLEFLSRILWSIIRMNFKDIAGIIGGYKLLWKEKI